MHSLKRTTAIVSLLLTSMAGPAMALPASNPVAMQAFHKKHPSYIWLRPSHSSKSMLTAPGGYSIVSGPFEGGTAAALQKGAHSIVIAEPSPTDGFYFRGVEGAFVSKDLKHLVIFGVQGEVHTPFAESYVRADGTGDGVEYFKGKEVLDQ
jgi:hypothetical protein